MVCSIVEVTILCFGLIVVSSSLCFGLIVVAKIQSTCTCTSYAVNLLFLWVKSACDSKGICNHYHKKNIYTAEGILRSPKTI